MMISLRPTTPMTDYTLWASLMHLMFMFFPHGSTRPTRTPVVAMHAQGAAQNAHNDRM